MGGEGKRQGSLHWSWTEFPAVGGWVVDGIAAPLGKSSQADFSALNYLPILHYKKITCIIVGVFILQ